MIEAVILAAGYSSRTSRYKMTLPLGEKTVLQHTVDSFLKVCNKVIVICGHNARECKKMFSNQKGVIVTVNPNYSKGMFSSVQHGVSQLHSDIFFVIPGDQPMVKAETLTQLLAADGDIVNPAFRGKKGHPVLFRGNSKKGILDMPENAVLRDYIHSHPSTVLEVDDEGILLDIDTDEDYENMATRFAT